MNLRVEAEVWQQAWMQLRYSFRSVHAPEFGVLGLVVPSLHPKRSALIINGLIMPDERSFDVQERDRLTFSTNYLRRAVLEARRCGAGIVVLHTHPEARDWVDFSPFDNLEEPQLVASLRDLLPGQWFASVVGGSQSFMGRVWAPKSTGWSQLDRLTVVGEPWNEFNLDGQPPTSVPSPGAMFDRALAVTGIGALGRLQRMRVAVVGTSGTGSLMAELLVRAGVGELLLVDDDRMGGENLNRILSSDVAE
ncbi:MAG: ThiF family adenylyltransferase, partial [Firmicutes bacterium]|nr:ThiF family adenylyltransferase [Bacillota bacterium]